jgi:hypothetical protein
VVDRNRECYKNRVDRMLPPLLPLQLLVGLLAFHHNAFPVVLHMMVDSSSADAMSDPGFELIAEMVILEMLGCGVGNEEVEKVKL